MKQKRNREKNKEYLNQEANKEKMEFNINLDFNKVKYGNDKKEIFDDDNDENSCNNNMKSKDINNKNKNKENDLNYEFDRMLDANCFLDLSRKIKKEDIIFEDKPYNIWDNNNIDDSLEKDF